MHRPPSGYWGYCCCGWLAVGETVQRRGVTATVSLLWILLIPTTSQAATGNGVSVKWPAPITLNIFQLHFNSIGFELLLKNLQWNWLQGVISTQRSWLSIGNFSLWKNTIFLQQWDFPSIFVSKVIPQVHSHQSVSPMSWIFTASNHVYTWPLAAAGVTQLHGPWISRNCTLSVQHQVHMHWPFPNRGLDANFPNYSWTHGSWSTLLQVVACCLAAPSHYLNHGWLINNYTHMKKVWWNFLQNWNVFMQGKTFQKVAYKMAAILFRFQCIKLMSLCKREDTQKQ